MEEDIDMVRVKLHGFSRHYSLESDRGGTMLEASDEDGYINGVIVTGLDDEQKDAIDGSESDYKTVNVPKDRIEPYVSQEELEDRNIKLTDEISVYVRDDDSEKFDTETSRSRNETYHGRILEGIDMLAEEYDTAFDEQFREDFEQTTYGVSVPGSIAITVAAKDRSIEGYRNYIVDGATEE